LENTENTPPAPTRLTDDETDVRLDAVRDLPFFQTKRSVVIRPVLKACAFDVEHTGRAINVLENIGCMDISAACEITANLNSLGDGESFKLLLKSVDCEKRIFEGIVQELTALCVFFSDLSCF